MKKRKKVVKDVEPKQLPSAAELKVDPTVLDPIAEGDDVFAVKELGPKSGPDDLPFIVHRNEDAKDLKMKSIAQYAAEALEVAGLAEKTADENLVTIIAAVPADGPSGTLSVVTARRVIHAVEDAGYKITK